MENEFLKFSMEDEIGGECGAKISVLGVGGCGCNIINDMTAADINGVELVAVNTDLQSLNRSGAEKLQIGKKLTSGRGAGSKPEKGEKAAEEDRELVEERLRGTDMLFIVAGLGGGTGSGASPVIADVARSMDILTVGMVVTPFASEMKYGEKKKIVEEAVAKLKDKVSNIIVISNDRIREICDRQLKVQEAYREINAVMISIIKGVIDMITKSGTQNIDFADVKTTLKQKGDAFIGIGGAAGTDRAQKALSRAINNPFVGNGDIKGAKNILISFAGDIEVEELDTIMEEVQMMAGEKASIKYGLFDGSGANDEIDLAILASGITHATEEADCGEEKEVHAKKLDDLVKQFVDSDYENVDIPTFKRMTAPVIKRFSN
ncbi:MAG TPA: cell division protein FtsZ [bacterium]|nr:cell division protein FtsZ [bacterium]